MNKRQQIHDQNGENTKKKFKIDDSSTFSTATTQVMSYGTKFESPVIKSNFAADVIISYWFSVHEFYVQLQNKICSFEKMMQNLQNNYKSASTSFETPQIGSDVIAKYPKDQNFYRATIIDYNEARRKFKVRFMDFGNVSIIGSQDVYEVQKEFFDLPIMAVKCSLNRIISCRDSADLSKCLHKYIDDTKKDMKCEFVLTENEQNLVNVQINGLDLKGRLIEDKFVLDLPEEIQLQCLVGQTLTLQLGEITSLLHFFVKISGCNLFFPCAYFDAQKGKAADAVINFKENFEHKTCIGRIESVTSANCLMVSLAMLNDFPVPLYCTIPCFKPKFEVTVVHIEDYNVLFCRPLNYKSQFEDYLKEMDNFYENQGTSLDAIKIDKLYACKSIENNRWCRAQTVVAENEKVKVKYIDFGHTETVPISGLRILEAKFEVNVSILKLYIAYKCSDESQRSAVQAEVAALTKGYNLSMDLVQPYKNVWIGGVSHLNVSMDNLLIYKKIVQPIDIPALCSQIDENEPSALRQPTFHIENCMLGFISHVEDPENFYVQLKSNTDALDSVQENLQIVAPSLPELPTYDVGTECIANYHLDENWYRAMIIDSNEEKITVLFCDFGNTDVIAATEKELLLKEKKYEETYTYFAKLCSLPIKKTLKHKDDVWNAMAIELLKKLVDQEIFFEPVTSSRSHQFINLFHTTENVTNFLIDNELAERLDLIVTNTTCFVSHVNSVSEFFVQYEKDGDSLDEMAKLLSNGENFPLLEGSIEVGAICVAVFPDDGCFYRAAILKNSRNSEYIVDVLYIDYGNHASVPRSMLKQLPNACASAPALAIKCTLELPLEVFKWSDEAESQFKNLTNAGETMFTIQLIEPDDPSVVDLLLDGKNISQQLALCSEKCENDFDITIKSIQENLKKSLKGPVQVVLFVSPGDFHIQFKNGATALDCIGDLLARPDFEILEKPEIGEVFAARFTDDDLYYRAKLVTSSTVDDDMTDDRGFNVYFIDYGNIAHATDLLKLPEKFAGIFPFATHCQFQDASKIAERDDSIKKALEEYLFEENAYFKLEIVDETADPIVIKLFNDGEDVIELITKKVQPLSMIDSENMEENDTEVYEQEAINLPMHVDEETEVFAMEEGSFVQTTNKVITEEPIEQTIFPRVVSVIGEAQHQVGEIESDLSSETEGATSVQITSHNFKSSEDVRMVEDCEENYQESKVVVPLEYKEESNDVIFVNETQLDDSEMHQ